MASEPLLIEVPAFVSEETTIDTIGALPIADGYFTYEGLSLFVKSKINDFTPINRRRKNKTTQLVISNLQLYEKTLPGERRIYLIRATALNYGRTDMILKKSKINKPEELSSNDKIGSDKFFFLLYPHIYGEHNEKLKWYILIYADPNKERSETIRVTKAILRKVFNITPYNIKPPKLIEKLKEIKIIPSVTIKLENTEEAELPELLKGVEIKKGVFKQMKTFVIENIPFKKIFDYIKDKKDLDDFVKKQIDLRIGRNTIKIEQILDEEKERANEFIEEIFNFTTEISESEIPKMYNDEFIVNKMHPILENFLGYASGNL